MKQLLLFISLFLFVASCREIDNCETLELPGRWNSTDTSLAYPHRLTVNDTIFEWCIDTSYCIGSGYYIQNDVIVFGSGTMRILEFSCDTISLETQQGIVNFEREQ